MISAIDVGFGGVEDAVFCFVGEDRFCMLLLHNLMKFVRQAADVQVLRKPCRTTKVPDKSFLGFRGFSHLVEQFASLTTVDNETMARIGLDKVVKHSLLKILIT